MKLSRLCNHSDATRVNFFHQSIMSVYVFYPPAILKPSFRATHRRVTRGDAFDYTNVSQFVQSILQEPFVVKSIAKFANVMATVNSVRVWKSNEPRYSDLVEDIVSLSDHTIFTVNVDVARLEEALEEYKKDLKQLKKASRAIKDHLRVHGIH